uniref:Non-structural protein 12A n=2 Tax=Rice dwarf virus TaxID=10991 RepID=NSP12_RDVA|nr:RecName: Full=Non-structural protein 12A; Short=Pns12A [Rice dwarf virus (isolate Akita)]AAP20946.1 P12 [Rice dwarf virus]BAA14223.1 unnamed protein product [Rice dwarf virus]
MFKSGSGSLKRSGSISSVKSFSGDSEKGLPPISRGSVSIASQNSEPLIVPASSSSFAATSDFVPEKTKSEGNLKDKSSVITGNFGSSGPINAHTNQNADGDRLVENLLLKESSKGRGSGTSDARHTATDSRLSQEVKQSFSEENAGGNDLNTGRGSHGTGDGVEQHYKFDCEEGMSAYHKRVVDTFFKYFEYSAEDGHSTLYSDVMFLSGHGDLGLLVMSRYQELMTLRVRSAIYGIFCYLQALTAYLTYFDAKVGQAIMLDEELEKYEIRLDVAQDDDPIVFQITTGVFTSGVAHDLRKLTQILEAFSLER